MRCSRMFLGLAMTGLGVLAFATPGLAQGAAAPERTITVSGEGEARAAPDEARLRAGVTTTARKAAEALAANTRAMNRVFATLKGLGIADKSIQTSDFTVSPQYASGSSTQEITGYQVTNQVVVTVDPAKLGAALDALVGSGANNLGSMELTIRDPKPLMAQARAAAMKDAAARAATYAAAGGFKLGPVLEVNEGGATMSQPSMRPMMHMAMEYAGAPAPVAGGENTLSVTVTVTYEIR